MSAIVFVLPPSFLLIVYNSEIDFLTHNGPLIPLILIICALHSQYSTTPVQTSLHPNTKPNQPAILYFLFGGVP
jgi:hypothetical protein